MFFWPAEVRQLSVLFILKTETVSTILMLKHTKASSNLITYESLALENSIQVTKYQPFF